MAFEVRKTGGNAYFYLSRRAPTTGKIQKVYVGRGAKAEAAARALDARRKQRTDERLALEHARAELRAVDGMMAELEVAAIALMEAAGFHRANYSGWRKRRAGDDHGGHRGASNGRVG